MKDEGRFGEGWAGRKRRGGGLTIFIWVWPFKEAGLGLLVAWSPNRRARTNGHGAGNCTSSQDPGHLWLSNEKRIIPPSTADAFRVLAPVPD